MFKLVEIYDPSLETNNDLPVVSYFIVDNIETRKQLIENYYGDYALESEEKSFLNGKIDTISFYLDGDDWDCPCGCTITIKDYKQKLHEIETEYNKNLANLINKFDKDVTILKKQFGVKE